MNRFSALFLLAGFAAGLGVGSAFRDKPQARVNRRTVPVTPSDSPTEAAPPVAPKSAAPRMPEIREAIEAAPVDADLTEGYGLIEVDFRGFRGDFVAWIAGMSMDGRRSEESVLAENGRAIAEVAPGLYEVWWADPETGRRLGSRVRAVAGRVLRLRATDARLRGPGAPAGLAVLSVRVLASWGGRLPDIPVYIEGNDMGGRHFIRPRTGAGGVLTVTLRPGSYEVRVKHYFTRVRLEAGRETQVEVRHQGQGDLLFDPPRIFSVSVQRRGGGVRLTRMWRGGEPERAGFLYLAAGTYDVFYDHGVRGAGTLIGTTVVRPGQATLFRYKLPSGGIVLLLPARPAPVVRLWRSKELVAVLKLQARGAYVLASASYLPAGLYHLRVDQGQNVLFDSTVDVRDEPFELDLR